MQMRVPRYWPSESSGDSRFTGTGIKSDHDLLPVMMFASFLEGMA